MLNDDSNTGDLETCCSASEPSARLVRRTARCSGSRLVRRSQRPARRERPSEQRHQSSKKPDGMHMYMRRRFTCHVPAPFVTMESWTHIFCSRRMRLPHVFPQDLPHFIPQDRTHLGLALLGPIGEFSCVCAGNVGLSKCSVRRTAGPLPHSTPHSAKQKQTVF